MKPSDTLLGLLGKVEVSRGILTDSDGPTVVSNRRGRRTKKEEKKGLFIGFVIRHKASDGGSRGFDVHLLGQRASKGVDD